MHYCLLDNSAALHLCHRKGPGKLRHIAGKLLWINDFCEEQCISFDETSWSGMCKFIEPQLGGHQQRDQHSAGLHRPNGSNSSGNYPMAEESDNERPTMEAGEGGIQILDPKTKMMLEAECFAPQQIGKEK